MHRYLVESLYAWLGSRIKELEFLIGFTPQATCFGSRVPTWENGEFSYACSVVSGGNSGGETTVPIKHLGVQHICAIGSKLPLFQYNRGQTHQPNSGKGFFSGPMK